MHKSRNEKIDAILRAVAGDKSKLKRFVLPQIYVLQHNKLTGLYVESLSKKQYTEQEYQLFSKQIDEQDDGSMIIVLRLD